MSENRSEDTGAKFLNERFPDLARSRPVRRIAARATRRTNQLVPPAPERRIQNYLDYLKEVIARPEPRGITRLKDVLTDLYVVRTEDIPDSYWQGQMAIRKSWQNLSEEEISRRKDEHLKQVRADQKGSLEAWIDYLTSDKASYMPDYLKYWTFASMLKLETYQKGKYGKSGRFPVRPSGRQRSVKMFPEINERALQVIASAYEATAKQEQVRFPPGRYDLEEKEIKAPFLTALKRKDFKALYTWGQENFPPISAEELQITEGMWITYPRRSKAKAVSSSLQGKASGWCIAGENRAREYLQDMNLAIYYTRDKEGNYTNPRVCIAYDEESIYEVRGTATQENVDSYIQGTNIIADKLQELPGGEDFFAEDADTKRLTVIELKMRNNETVDVDELTFLYELHKSIKYFGKEPDPRIYELRNQRNQEEDIARIFSCTPSQIAHHWSEIGTDTKVYVGNFDIAILHKLIEANVDHIFTSFPEGEIQIQDIRIGGDETKEQLQWL